MPHGMMKNSIVNFLGAAIPAVANLVAVPLLVHNLGTEDYGLLTLVLALVGYFALLDINATQGSIRFIAEYDSLGQPRKANEVISISLIIYLSIGFAGLFLILLSAPALIEHVFEIQSEKEDIALFTLRLAGVAFLFSQLQAYLVSIPQAMQQYKVSAATEAVFGTITPLLSAAVAVLGYGIEDVILARLILSIINVAVLWRLVKCLRPDLSLVKATKATTRNLVSFSAYSYLSRIAAVSQAHMDRVILGIFLGMTHITYYSIPVTLCNRLFGMTFRLGSVIYPAVSQLNVQGDADNLQRIYLSASRYITAINSFLLLLIIVYGQDLLNLWVGSEFVEEGYPILVIATLAMMIDSMTNLPSLMNNAIGHPKITGYFAVARAIIGVILLTVGTIWWGIIGTAIGHLIGSILMTVLFLIYVHSRLGAVPVLFMEVVTGAYLPALLVCGITSIVALVTKPDYPGSILTLTVHGSLVSVIYVIFALIIVVKPEHRERILIRLHCKSADDLQDD